MLQIVSLAGLFATTPQLTTATRDQFETEEILASNASLNQQQSALARSYECPHGTALPDGWPVLEEVSLLGKGAFGTVNLCKIIKSGSANWIPREGAEIAVKTAENMGERELEIARWLAANPELDTGFPRIYGVGPKAIAMEKMDGDLMNWAIDRAVENVVDEEDVEEEHVQPREVTTPDEVKFLLANSCESLKRVHETNILHRDIKPENIGVANNGHIVRLLDIGSACSSVIGGEVATCEAAGEESCVSTRPYFAPELWWCSCRPDFAEQFWDCAGAVGAASEQTDIFAFGRAAVQVIEVAVWGEAGMRWWPPTAANIEAMLRDLDSWHGVNWRQLLSPDPGERQLPADCRSFFATLDASKRLPVVEEWDEDNAPEEAKHRTGFSWLILEGIKKGELTIKEAREIQRRAQEKTKQVLRDEEQRAINKKEQKRLELERRKQGTAGVFKLRDQQQNPVGTKNDASKTIVEVIEEDEEEGDHM